jgi:Glu-tRNA(Gln) amidotransferase subunit E-like FAD-binding protein
MPRIVSPRVKLLAMPTGDRRRIAGSQTMGPIRRVQQDQARRDDALLKRRDELMKRRSKAPAFSGRSTVTPR